MGRKDLEKEAEVTDKEGVSVKTTQKWSVQKMITCDLVEAHQTSSHQCPGAVCNVLWQIFDMFCKSSHF